MHRLLAALSKSLVVWIPLTMVLGFICGLLVPSGWMQALIVPLTILMVYPMMVGLKLSAVLEGGAARVQWLAQLINFGIIPFVAFVVGRLFFPEQPYYAIGLLLAALLPTSGMTISWTGFAGGNLGAAVKMTVLGLILGSLATPFYLQWLMGAAVDMNLQTVFLQIIFIVFVPMLAGYFTRSRLIHKYGESVFKRDWAPRFPPFSMLGVLGVVFVAMALKAPQLVHQPQDLLYLIAPLVVLYSINYLVSSVIAKWMLPRGDAIALVYGTVMRNLSIALALAMNAFGPAGSDAALILTLAYVIQVQSAAWYVRLTDRIFGTPQG